MSDERDAPIPFNPSRGRAGRRRAVERLQDAIDEFRAAMESEQRARLEWMRRHSGLLGLEIPDDAPPTREVERAFMVQAGRRLREPLEGADPAAIALAREELAALERAEREGFERLVGRHGAALGLEDGPRR